MFNMKKSELYLPSGYLNWENILALPVAHIFIIGGRGIGKTYGILEYEIKHSVQFIFVRRTQTQVDEIAVPTKNPFKTLNTDNGWEIIPKSASKNTYQFINQTNPEDIKPVGDIVALSTFANIRGFDGSDKDHLLVDEFIPELHQNTLRGEADAVFNMIETINRNREFVGRDPLKCIFMSNSTSADNPIFIELGLVSLVMKLSQKKEFIYVNKDRQIAIIMPMDSPISEKKKDTALYKMTKGTSFYNSAILNDFVNNNPRNIASRSLKEYRPLVKAGEICIYKHKSKNLLYVSLHASGKPPSYSSSYKELTIFRKRYFKLQKYVVMDAIEYENYTCEVLFDRYMEMW